MKAPTQYLECKALVLAEVLFFLFKTSYTCKLLLAREKQFFSSFLIYKSLSHLLMLMKTINKESTKVFYRRDVNNRQSRNHYFLTIEKLRHAIALAKSKQ